MACDDTLDARRELERDEERGGTDEEPVTGVTDRDEELSVWYLRESHRANSSILIHSDAFSAVKYSGLRARSAGGKVCIQMAVSSIVRRNEWQTHTISVLHNFVIPDGLEPLFELVKLSPRIHQ